MRPRDLPSNTQRDYSREEHFIRTFVRKDRRRRYLELISSPKGRIKFLKALAHTLELEPSCAHPIQPSAQTPNHITTLLESWGAPKECYIISESAELDGQCMDLRRALAEVVGFGIGSILCCTPELAYYEAEGTGERFLLLRGSTGPHHQ
jgi:hypothetical protein